MAVFEYLTNDLYADRSFAILSFSIIATLWSASKGLHSVLYGLNKVAGAEETRPWLHRRLLCMMYTLVTLAALILTLLLNVFGKRILAFLEVHRMLLYVPLSQIMRHTHLYSLALLTLYFPRSICACRTGASALSACCPAHWRRPARGCCFLPDFRFM